MEITEITIKNFKGIEEVKMGPIKPINVLIGRNNSGKSSVLACLQLLNKYFTAVISAQYNQPNITPVPGESFRREKVEKTGFEVSVTVKQTKNERNAQFNDLVKTETMSLRPETVSTQLDRNLFDTLIFDFGGVQGSTKNTFGLISIRTIDVEGTVRKDVSLYKNPNPGSQLNGVSLLLLFNHTRQGILRVSQLANQIGSAIAVEGGRLVAKGDNPGALVGLLNPAFEYVKSAFQTAFMVSPYRHGDKQGDGQRCQELNGDGTNIVNRLHDLNLNNNKIFEEVAGFVKKIAPDVGRLHTRHVSSGRELELAYEWPEEDRVVNLVNMGGGIEQLLILGCILIQQKTSCVLWEEPESHLHPGAQDILLSELEKRIKDSRIFISTHSPVFIRSSDKIAVHIITNKDGKSGEGRTLLEDELQEAAVVLGARAGHLAMADIVVYVEGKWGVTAFEEWLKKWPNRNNVLGHLLLVIESCNPDEIGTEDFDIGKLKKVTPKMVMFVDKDNESGSDEPKKARKVLNQMCENIGIPCIITEKRQIEDYFTEEAVKQGLPSNLSASWKYDASKPIGEQIPNGWKKYNAKIAAAMKWEDIEKHKDIMQVFDGIKEYAKNLKPETNGR